MNYGFRLAVSRFIYGLYILTIIYKSIKFYRDIVLNCATMSLFKQPYIV